MKMKTIQYQGVFDNQLGGSYRIERGNLILGKSRFLYIHNLGYSLTELKVYADGMIDCWGLITLEEFKQKIAKGWATTSLPEGAGVYIHLLGDVTTSQVENFILPQELIKEIEDTIQELNGELTSSDRCQEAYKRYLNAPTAKHKTQLRVAYYAMPEHMRVFVLGDMDVKDAPITSIIDTIDIQEIQLQFPYGKDERFIALYKHVLQGELEFYSAMIELRGIAPKNNGVITVSNAFRAYFMERYHNHKPIPLHVYPEGDHFVMSDDYLSFTLYRELGDTVVPCFVLGTPQGKYVQSKTKLSEKKITKNHG